VKRNIKELRLLALLLLPAHAWAAGNRRGPTLGKSVAISREFSDRACGSVHRHYCPYGRRRHSRFRR